MLVCLIFHGEDSKWMQELSVTDQAHLMDQVLRRFGDFPNGVTIMEQTSKGYRFIKSCHRLTDPEEIDAACGEIFDGRICGQMVALDGQCNIVE